MRRDPLPIDYVEDRCCRAVRQVLNRDTLCIYGLLTKEDKERVRPLRVRGLKNMCPPPSRRLPPTPPDLDQAKHGHELMI